MRDLNLQGVCYSVCVYLHTRRTHTHTWQWYLMCASRSGKCFQVVFNRKFVRNRAPKEREREKRSRRWRGGKPPNVRNDASKSSWGSANETGSSFELSQPLLHFLHPLLSLFHFLSLSVCSSGFSALWFFRNAKAKICHCSFFSCSDCKSLLFLASSWWATCIFDCTFIISPEGIWALQLR